jgi:hypothetical protein
MGTGGGAGTGVAVLGGGVLVTVLPGMLASKVMSSEADLARHTGRKGCMV